jgi:hypothetical protein
MDVRGVEAFIGRGVISILLAVARSRSPDAMCRRDADLSPPHWWQHVQCSGTAAHQKIYTINPHAFASIQNQA